MISIFEVIGPTMIGPSSSHTAGACRIGWAARRILDEPVESAQILLHGSFLATGEGHATPEALIAGLLGMAPDNEDLPKAWEIAEDGGMNIQFGEIDLGSQAHPNSVRLLLEGKTRKLELTASSVGGGSICIVEIDGMPVEIRGTLETLLFWHDDIPGYLARITTILACADVNVATIRTCRTDRGKDAFTYVEIDSTLPAEASVLLSKMHVTHRLTILPMLPGR